MSGRFALLTAATGQMPVVSHRAWVWDLQSHPLGAAYGAVAADRALSTCTHNQVDIGRVSPLQPLPQAVNRCIVPLM